ncbi:MAG: YggS family pyridoxal phosphate-dependent enzyme [Pirellulales bacterium]|nr:YggS family pyridoxal phosphate-dependent enzyme [Pirellulales bacterium]
MNDTADIVRSNLARVQDQIADAAASADRNADDISLVGVTKYVEADVARVLFDAGCKQLGESRPQQLVEKAESLAEVPIEWHMIGHLQRNKVRRVLPLVSLIHSGDSLRLVEAIDRIAAEENIASVRVLIEVNVSGEEAKHGFAPSDVAPSLDALSQLEHVEIAGLMCMARRGSQGDEARRDFAALRELRDRLATNCPDATSLSELSIGMSGDFAEAIREGATIVRVGSALFEGVG